MIVGGRTIDSRPSRVQGLRVTEPSPPEKRRGVRGIARLVALLRPYRARFALACVSLVIGSSIGLAYPQAVRYAIDHGITAREPGVLDRVAVAVFGLFVLQALFTWIRAYLMNWLGERVVADLRRRVFDRLVTLPVGWYHDRRSGELTGRLAGDVAILEGVIGSELSLALRALLQLVGATTILFVRAGKLAVLMLAIVPAMTITIMLFGRRVRVMAKAVQDRLAESHGRAQEVVSAIATVQAFVRETHEREAYAERIESAFSEARRLARWRASFFAVSSMSGYLVIGAIIWLGGKAVMAGELSAGDLTEFLAYTALVAIALGMLTSLWQGLERASGATARLYEVIDTEPTIHDPAAPVALPPGGGAVELERVEFAYPSRPDRRVLRHVKLRIRPGETVALVGPSGAGKTTLASLLFRFFDPDEGHVRLEGIDVRELRLAELRRALAWVPQEPVLFSGTIAENIAYGRGDATREQIETAARDAHAHEFVSTFAEGYETRVGERGVKLSGGQRQRIAIARALLADPRVLVLDEATSNLDAESEALVQEALERLMKGRTTLVIAHRLSTIKRADRICVMEGGAIVEVGTHDQLMAKGGVYRKLVDHQLIDAA